MVDRSSVGRQGTPFTMHLELGKVRELARATRCEREFSDGDPVPPTFLTTAFHWQNEASDILAQAQMDPGRSLHAEQDFVFHGPPPAIGSTLTGISRIADIYDKAGRRSTLTFVEVVTTFTDESGRVVAEARLTGIESAAEGSHT